MFSIFTEARGQSQVIPRQFAMVQDSRIKRKMAKVVIHLRHLDGTKTTSGLVTAVPVSIRVSKCLTEVDLIEPSVTEP
jgi:hypothetical protein